ncbi:DUF1206 domain-containing protein [Arthrobacter celericrescens]|uniref:DUF1206 domain-containing protein n=1 Tax=Arthrobacter celericrescens TaxID=2320851 RepID=UPI000EA38A7A|nr:DUF1206 domain-containing protein [Arthrobacter celericrescens]
MDKSANKTARTAEAASNSPALETAARAGFAASGVLHVIVGAIAFQLARGLNGEADVGGAVAQLAGSPGGPFLLWACFAACAALALWRLGDAIFGGPGPATGTKRLTSRAGAAGQALVFALLSATVLSFALGGGKSNRESASDLTVTLLRMPFGVVLLLMAGAAIIGVGIFFAVRGARVSFRKDLFLPGSPVPRRVVLTTGVTGYLSKGCALLLVGVLVIMATVRHQPEQSTGLDGGLKGLREQPYGPYLLGALALGLVCYGCFLILKGKYARM